MRRRASTALLGYRIPLLEHREAILIFVLRDCCGVLVEKKILRERFVERRDGDSEDGSVDNALTIEA